MLKYLQGLCVVIVLMVSSSVGAAVITTVEWESKPGLPWSYSGGAVDCSVPASPAGGCALRFTYNAGTYATSDGAGGGQATYAVSPSQTDLYFGSWQRYSSNFVFHAVGQKATFFILAGSFNGNTGNCRNVAMGFIYGTYAITPQICWADGSSTYNNFANKSGWDETAHLNEWHWYEWRMKLNTPGVANGVAEMWIDDELHLQYFNVKFRDVGDSAGMGSIQHSSTYGGGGSTIASTMYWYVDHTVVSTTRIGMPGGTPPPPGDTTPPTAPTNLVFQ